MKRRRILPASHFSWSRAGMLIFHPIAWRSNPQVNRLHVGWSSLHAEQQTILLWPWGSENAYIRTGNSGKLLVSAYADQRWFIIHIRHNLPKAWILDRPLLVPLITPCQHKSSCSMCTDGNHSNPQMPSGTTGPHSFQYKQLAGRISFSGLNACVHIFPSV